AGACRTPHRGLDRDRPSGSRPGASGETVSRCRFPELSVVAPGPVGPGVLVRGTELGCSEQSYRLAQRGRTRLETLGRGVGVEVLDLLVREAHTDLHTLILPAVGMSGYRARI